MQLTHLKQQSDSSVACIVSRNGKNYAIWHKHRKCVLSILRSDLKFIMNFNIMLYQCCISQVVWPSVRIRSSSVVTLVYML